MPAPHGHSARRVLIVKHLHTPSHTVTHLHTPSHTVAHLHTPSHTVTHTVAHTVTHTVAHRYPPLPAVPRRYRARRVLIFEASRSRKGKLANSHYRLQLPAKDPRYAHVEGRGVTGDDPLYCGKLRSYNLSGANFVVYDDGYKAEEKRGAGSRQPPVEAPRRQLAAMVFQKSTSRRAPMSMRVLVPSVDAAAEAVPADLLEALQACNGHVTAM